MEDRKLEKSDEFETTVVDDDGEKYTIMKTTLTVLDYVVGEDPPIKKQTTTEYRTEAGNSVTRLDDGMFVRVLTGQILHPVDD